MIGGHEAARMLIGENEAQCEANLGTMRQRHGRGVHLDLEYPIIDFITVHLTARYIDENYPWDPFAPWTFKYTHHYCTP